MPNHYHKNAPEYSRRPSDDGTDSVAFRALESLLKPGKMNSTAVDAGCGTGRSTRFLKKLGFISTGLDISGDMLREARINDPGGTYVSYAPDDMFPFGNEMFDIVLSTWAVLEISSKSSMAHFMSEAGRVLKSSGKIIIVANTPEFYSHRWVNCAVDFPENNGPLASGQQVTVRLEPEGIQIHDYFWHDADYRSVFESAGLVLRQAYKPTADIYESGWLDETHVAPYIIYELEKGRSSR